MSTFLAGFGDFRIAPFNPDAFDRLVCTLTLLHSGKSYSVVCVCKYFCCVCEKRCGLCLRGQTGRNFVFSAEKRAYARHPSRKQYPEVGAGGGRPFEIRRRARAGSGRRTREGKRENFGPCPRAQLFVRRSAAAIICRSANVDFGPFSDNGRNRKGEEKGKSKIQTSGKKTRSLAAIRPHASRDASVLDFFFGGAFGDSRVVVSRFLLES